MAFAFSTPTGYDDLVVANAGDGVLAVFAGSPKGLTLESSVNAAELRHAKSLQVSRITSDEIRFSFRLDNLVLGSGQTEGPSFTVLVNPVTGVPQFLGPGSLSFGGSQLNSASQGTGGVAQLVALQETSLPLVGTLLPLSVEAPASAAPVAGGAEGVPALVSPPGAPVSLGQAAFRPRRSLRARGPRGSRRRLSRPRTRPPGREIPTVWPGSVTRLGTGNAARAIRS